MEIHGFEQIVDKFPLQLQMPVRELTTYMKWEMATYMEREQIASKEDFTELKSAIHNLAMLQTHTEEKVQNLTEAQERLARAQERTEEKVQNLTEAQERTEEKVQNLTEAQERLARAQERTEEKVQNLTEAQERTEEKVQKLTEAQERTEEKLQKLTEAQERTEEKLQNLDDRVTEGFKSLSDQIAALGGRWGIYNEGTFRATICGLFENVEGVRVEKGHYGGREVDMVIRNGEHILLEITSRMHRKDIEKLYSSADDYLDKVGVEPKLMVATSYISPRLMQKIMGLERPIDIFSYESE